MIIRNGLVFQEDKTFAKKDIVIKNGRIVEAGEPGEEIIDATGLYVLPGLIDIHSHGAVGYDFSDGEAEGLKEILVYQYAHGVTSYCPTSMTLEREKLLEVFKQAGKFINIEEEIILPDKCGNNSEICKQEINGKWKSEACQEERKLARIAGFHMEGPFLDASKKGAHREEDILPPDVDFFRECNEACGNRIRLVTVAPNAAGAVEFIRKIAGNQRQADTNSAVTVSLGHTATDYNTAKDAFTAGATHVTHLFNAMSPMNHRNPGLIGAAAENENCMAELICDGVHVHESMVRAAFKLFPGRIVLISDSMRAAGLADGEYGLGGQQVIVRGNLATLSDGTIAGSVTNLFDCMRKAISFGVPAEEAVAAATMNPAKSIGIFGEVGSLTPGKRADVILVDKAWKLKKVL